MKMIHVFTPDRLVASVLAVPPLCRGSDFSLNEPENAKLIRHLESGGVRTLLYGGNANFYLHRPPARYDHRPVDGRTAFGSRPAGDPIGRGRRSG